LIKPSDSVPARAASHGLWSALIQDRLALEDLPATVPYRRFSALFLETGVIEELG
jgi:hypothetical protein